MKTTSLLASLSALIAPVMSHAALFLNGTVTPLTGSYWYEVSVQNTGPEDYVIVSIPDAPLADPLIDPSLTGPADFLTNYDDGLGYVAFVEDTDLFAAGKLFGPFSFESLAGPGQAFSTFEALTTVGDPITGPIQWVVVPEPAAATVAVALGLFSGALIWRRRRFGA